MFIFLKKQYIYNFIFAISLVASAVLLFNPQNRYSDPAISTSLSGRVVVIDAGHGSPDAGTTGLSGSMEKDLNLAVARKLGKFFVRGGAHVVYTRESDGTIADNLDETIRNIKRNDMSKRKHIRDNSKADIFISIHMNFFSDSKYSGAQVFYDEKNDESRKLAASIQKYIKEFADISNTRKAKDSKGNIFILNDTKVTSVLVECGFLSNPDEERRLLTASYQEKIAYAIFSGTLKYFSNT